MKRRSYRRNAFEVADLPLDNRLYVVCCTDFTFLLQCCWYRFEMCVSVVVHREVGSNMLLIDDETAVIEEVALDDNTIIETVEEIPQDEQDGFTDDGQLELVVEESDGNFVHMGNGDLLYAEEETEGEEEGGSIDTAHIKQESADNKARILIKLLL